MGKALIINDLHIGCRNDSLIFHTYFREYIEKYFFPLIEEEKPEAIFILGDIFDRRKYLNFNTLFLSEEYLFKPLNKLGIPVHIIYGNHDLFYKHSNKINSVSLILS